MKVSVPLFIGSVSILWSGRLIPRLPSSLQDAAIAGNVALLTIWLVLLSRLNWGDPTRDLWAWRSTWVPQGIAVGIGLFLLGGLGYVVSQRILRFSPPSETDLIGTGVDLRFGLLLASALGAAALEEWVFRGLLLGKFSSLPGWVAVTGSALLFAAYHGSLFQLIPTFILGVGLGALVYSVGSLWPAVIAHGVFNLIGLLLTTFGTGLHRAG